MKSYLPQGVRNALRPYYDLAGRMSVGIKRRFGDQGRLPDFLILGAQKSGTTSLYDILIQHPSIASSRTKEICFFDRYYDRGLAWYAANFDAESDVTGEATPDYLFIPEALERISKDLPDAKFIILLRNPVDRAVSQYFHAKRLGYEAQSLEHALAQEESRVSGLKGYAGNAVEKRTALHAYSYFSRGKYAEQISKWLERFDRDRFYIDFSDRFFTDPESVARDVFEFLGVSPDVPLDTRPQNVGKYTGKIPASIYDQLEKDYETENNHLAELLKRDVPW